MGIDLAYFDEWDRIGTTKPSKTEQVLTGPNEETRKSMTPWPMFGAKPMGFCKKMYKIYIYTYIYCSFDISIRAAGGLFAGKREQCTGC